MANTGLLRDWLWFYQNGGKLARYSNVNKTSRFNLTVKEAVDNYKIDTSLVSGLPDNEMIAHDSIRFENVLGGVGNNGYINTVESINEDLVIIGGKFNEFNNETCNSCIFLQPRLNTDFNLNFSQSIFPRHVNVYKNGGIGEIRKIRAKYIPLGGPNPYWDVVFCGDYDTFEFNGVPYPSSGFDIIRITKNTNTKVISYTYKEWTNVFNGQVFDFDFSREFEVDDREVYIVGNFTAHNGAYTPGIIKYDYRDGTVKDHFTDSQFSAPTFQGTKTVVRSIKKEVSTGSGVVLNRYSIAVGGLFTYKNALNETCNNFIITNTSGRFNNSTYLHSGKALHNFGQGRITDITHIYQTNGDVDYGISGEFSSYNGYSSHGFVVLRYSSSSTGSRTIFDIVYPKSNVNVRGTVKGILTPKGVNTTRSLYFYGDFTDMQLITRRDYSLPELINPYLSGLNGICRYEWESWITYTSGGIGVNTSSTRLKQGFWGGTVNDMVRIKNVSQPGYVYEVYMVVGSFKENINGTKSFGIAILVMEQITPASGIKPGPSFSIYPNSEYYFNPDNK